MNVTVRPSGRIMLEILQRIFDEMDQMGFPMAEAVRCPHADMSRGDGTLTYMGRELDFCEDCHGLVADEFKRINAGLLPREVHRDRARAFMASAQ